MTDAWLTDVGAREIDDVSHEAVVRLFDDLDAHQDEETASVDVTHSSGWNLEFSRDLTVLEDVESDPGTEKHMRRLSRAEQIRLARLLVDGELDTLHAMPWSPGYS